MRSPWCNHIKTDDELISFPLFLVTGRAKRKIDELAHLLDVAKMNYRQLGGVLDEDQKKHEEERESARWVKIFIH